MSKTAQTWKVGIAAAAVLAVITSIPQLYFWYTRSSDWNGSPAYLDIDELAYGAYINALIDGRPRRNDPYTGKDDRQSETLFSIQFLPAYAVALPARLFQVSAATAFIFLIPLATIAAALVVTWFLSELTDNVLLAGAGTIGVVCLGTVAAINPLQILMGLQTHYDLFPFLRRYTPALPFSIFVALSLFTWRALTRSPRWAVMAGFCFAILVYSYFFLWTAAAAWFFTIIVLWFFARPEDRGRLYRVSGILVLFGAAALAPYLWLLTSRDKSMDSAQLLEGTHIPDLFRAPEIYGAFILMTLLYQVIRKKIGWRDPKVLIIASFAIAPFIVFNQQVLTGYSLQPFHYEEFVTNYWIVLAVFLAFGISRRHLPTRIFSYLAFGGLVIGLVLASRAAKMGLNTNIHLDEARGVALKLREENQMGTVFASNLLLTDSLATTARNPVLWARHLYAFSNVDSAGQKRRFYQYLYYSGFDQEQFGRTLRTDFTAQWEIFGADRANPVLSTNSRHVTDEEILQAASEYAVFVNAFDLSVADNPRLSLAIVSPDDNLSNLDRWYERAMLETRGEFVIYRLTLKVPN